MQILVIAIWTLESFWLLWILTHATVPKMAGAKEKIRCNGTDSLAGAIMLAVVFLLILGMSVISLRDGSWQVALMLATFEPVFLYLMRSFAFDGVRYGEDGFALRDDLGRVRTFRWAEVEGVEKLQRRGKHSWEPFVAVYLPGTRLCFDRDVGIPFLRFLKRKRGELPANRPETGFFRGRVFLGKDWVTENVLMLIVALGFAAVGATESGRYPWLWAIVLLGVAGCVGTVIVGRRFDDMPLWARRLFFRWDPYMRKPRNEK